MSSAQDNDIRAVFETNGLINGRFTNVCRLGTSSTGRFSWIYIADDQFARKQVALKVLNPFEQDVYRKMAFEREEQLLQRFRD